MIKIDREDSLYRYLKNLGETNLDSVYVELATNGRMKRSEVMAYFGEKFTPSLTTDFEESELEKIVDYYIDLRKAKHLLQSEVNKLLKEYKSNHDMAAREKVINSSLRDVMYMCLNYQSKHKSIDIQDAIAVGNIGLIEAIEHYDPNARIDFKDYVIYWLARRIDEDFKEEK